MIYWFCAGIWCGFALYAVSDGKWLKAALHAVMALSCIAGGLGGRNHAPRRVSTGGIRSTTEP
jgi:hypothetical protein